MSSDEVSVKESVMERFNSKILNLISIKEKNCRILTKEKYNEILNKVKRSQSKVTGKDPEDYQRLKRYDIVKVGGCEKLIYPMNAESSDIKYYVHTGELFDIIHETHMLIGHGGRNRMMKELQKKYKNVTCEEVMVYLNLCEWCQKKTRVLKKALVVQPIKLTGPLNQPLKLTEPLNQNTSFLIQEMNSRCQVDLIDMQSRPEQDYKFILVYQDYLTKFIQLRPLKTKRAEEVAHVLIDIFTIFGAPNVLQSDSGREFCSEVIEEACAIWTDLKIVHGKSRHGQSQGLYTNQDVENMLNSWLETNQSQHWTKGLRFVQQIMNRSYHHGIKCSPHEAMFGSPLKLGLKTSSSLPNSAVANIRTEEELQEIITSLDQNQTEFEKLNQNISEKIIENEQTSLNFCDIPEVIVPDVQSDMEVINLLKIENRKGKVEKRNNAKSDLEKQSKKLKISDFKLLC